MRTSLFITALLIAASTSSARAQLTSPPAPGGITVIGRGVVRVHADLMRFAAVLYPTNFRGPAATPAPPPADVGGAADAIANALRGAGVADAMAGSGNLNSAAVQRVVTGTVRNPTRAGIEDLVRKGNAAAIGFPNVGLQNITYGLYVNDCSSPEGRAQDAALADARQRAERVARAAGVRLGTVTGVNEATLYGPPGTANCVTRPDVQLSSGQNGSLPRNDTDEAMNGDVFVSVTATVTFAIAR